MRNKATMIISAAAGVVSVLVFLAMTLQRVGEFPGLPARMAAVEHANSELTRRVDVISGDLKTISRDMENDSRRTVHSFNELHQKLAEMAGVLRDVRDQGVKSQSDLASVKEKAANAAVLADDANRAALEIKAKWENEHKKQ